MVLTSGALASSMFAILDRFTPVLVGTTSLGAFSKYGVSLSVVALRAEKLVQAY